MKIILIMIAFFVQLWGFENHKIEPDFVKNGDYMGIKILDSKVLASNHVDGLKFCEISDIAYDKTKDLLYALSDKGRLFTLSIMIENKKIKSLKALSSKALRGLNGKKLFGAYKDSEGLALVGESLLVSFERKPRILRYDKNFRPQKMLPLPIPLNDIKNYRSKNKALEALTYNEKYGYITTAEYSLKGEKRGYHDIYTSKGKLCKVKIADSNVAITEMEMMPDGSLLLLLRKFILHSFTFETTLLKVDLEGANVGICQSEVLSWMSSKDGWNIDNFEGLTHIKDNLYLMISDNNNNIFEKTILTLFEIKEK